MTNEANDAQRWIDLIESIPRFKGKSGRRAPYKPLLLLWLIGRISNQGDPEVCFQDAETELQTLLNEFRVGSTAPKPEHPFVYFGSKPDLWQVTDRSGKDIFRMSAPLDASRSAPARETVTFLRREATGRLSEGFVKAVQDTEQRDQIVNYLLESEFPPSTHEDVLSRCDLLIAAIKRVGRDPSFRTTVLIAYENQCSFCSFGAYLRGESVSVDAAHLRMHSKNGPNVIENGVALCVLHHRLFDRGAIGLSMQDGERKILVSQHLNVFDDPSSRTLLALSQEPMRLPQRGYAPPDKSHIQWHYENLFQHPARA